jgi:hypothetical protein
MDRPNSLYAVGARRQARHDRLQTFVKVWIGGVMIFSDPHGFAEGMGSLVGSFLGGTGVL